MHTIQDTITNFAYGLQRGVDNDSPVGTKRIPGDLPQTSFSGTTKLRRSSRTVARKAVSSSVRFSCACMCLNADWRHVQGRANPSTTIHSRWRRWPGQRYHFMSWKHKRTTHIIYKSINDWKRIIRLCHFQQRRCHTPNVCRSLPLIEPIIMEKYQLFSWFGVRVPSHMWYIRMPTDAVSAICNTQGSTHTIS